jgi:hypothetical protein
MSERLGVAKSTYVCVEKGDPTVSMGAYAMALFAMVRSSTPGSSTRNPTAGAGASSSALTPSACRQLVALAPRETPGP